MTDKEMLELATKAAGWGTSSWVWSERAGGFRYRVNGEWVVWNPLTDDGDAFRLAVTLKIDIRPSMSGSSKFRYAVYDGLTYGEVDSDPPSATRRAIVRAAAEIGKGMK